MKRFIISSLLILMSGILVYISADEKLPKRTDEEIQTLFTEFESNAELVDGKWVFKKVIQQDGSATELFDRSIEAIAQLFKDIKDPIQDKDREAGKVVAKIDMPDIWYRTGTFSEICYVPQYILTIETKDNRYRLKLLVNQLTRKNFNSGAIKQFSVRIEECYPYNKEVKTKDQNKSFQGLWFTYINAQLILTEIENLMKSAAKDDEW